MKLKLGTNLGFAINKYTEPEVWGKIVGEDWGLHSVQFVADLLNPFLPDDYIKSQIERILKVKEKYNFDIDSIFTSAFTRVNHLMNPDKEARQIWINWFKRFFEIGAQLGAKSGGSHFGIMTFDTYLDENKREKMIEEAIRGWQELSFYAQDLNYDCLIFEPMSVPREMANTVEDTKYLMDRVNENCGVPMRLCLDVGHAPHPAQRDPYPWLEKLSIYSPIIHLQQTQLNKSMHWPFTDEYNEQGIISGERVLDTIEKAGVKEAILMFELSHREHWDTEGRILPDHKASVEYWRQFVKD